MSQICGGIFTSHVPGIGNAIAKGLQSDPYWKPFFDGFDPVHQCLPRAIFVHRSGVRNGQNGNSDGDELHGFVNA